MKCREVLWNLVTNREMVCEAEKGTEHTHATLQPYMRYLRPTEKAVYDKQRDIAYLGENRAEGGGW